ncbi:D-ribose ABC transporter substrate-binding protein [Pseudobutyrivibrio sp. MD2005]|uniref:D-ribose ABC transporter substrate-binding protein n=1 Tax=Pseudobutyrivibrio sp. MD2005 TaxID=1410616 RepID=UPI000489CF7B|nr:D-ribose ABC transporter substrate-binding protein [Pseudobutyrivibrio sp. MD2005]
MKLRRLFTMALAGLMTLAMVGCGAVGIDGETSSDTTKTEATAGSDTTVTGSGSVGLSVSTLNNPFFVTLQEGAQSKADELGIDLIVVDAGDDSAKQASDIEDLVSKDISVLIVNPVDSDAVAPAVEDAVAKGIKVIAVDRVVNGVDVDCSIASDNVAGAQMAADYLVELVGEGTKVAELEGVNGASATIDRGEGFHKVADEKLDVVASQTANFNRAEGMSVMENILQANPDVKAVFAHNDEMALGAVEAIGGKDIVVAGFDATDDAIAAVKDGTMACTVAQKPDLMGATAVEVAQKLMNGETVEKSMPVEVKLITKDNVEE